MEFVIQDFKLPPADKHPIFYVGIFAAIGICGRLISILAFIVECAAALKASSKMFEQLLDSTVHATVQWFDTTHQSHLVDMFYDVCDYSASSAPNLTRLLRTST